MQWYVRNSSIYCPKSRKNLLSSQLRVKMCRSTSKLKVASTSASLLYECAGLLGRYVRIYANIS